MKTTAIAYLAGLVGVAVDGRSWSIVLFVGSALTAAVVRHLVGRGRCRRRGTARAKRYFAGSR